MKLALPWPVDQFEAELEKFRGHLVALLVGAPNANRLQDQLVQSVEEAHEELNVKASGEHLILNRQGLLYLVPKGDYSGPHSDRFDKSLDLASLAFYARTLLSEAHGQRDNNPEEVDAAVHRLEQWIRRADTTFDSSVTQTLTWSALSKELLLRQRLSAWRDYFPRARPL